MNQQFPKCVLIDPENVLFASNEIFYDSINISFLEVTNGKVKIEKEVYRKFLSGVSYNEIINFIFTYKPKISISESDRKKIADRFTLLSEKILITSKQNGTKKYHLDVFNWIVNAGSKICICTNVNYELVMKYFDAVGYLKFFEEVITPDNQLKSKPDIQMYEYLFERYKLEPDEVFSIEGTLHGITAARNSNIEFIVSTKPENLTLKNFIEAAQVKEVLTIQ